MMHFTILRLLLLGVLGGGLLAAGLLIRTESPAFSKQSTLGGVNEHDLAKAGITLYPADGPPKVSREEAHRIASSRHPDQPILGSSFGHMVGSMRPFEALVWVVSFDPTGVPPSVSGPSPPPGETPQQTEYVTDYLLVVVDAETGDFLFGAALSHRVE